MQNSAWGMWARDFAERLGADMQWLDPAKVTVIALYCKSGRDRSVGCSVIAANWLRQWWPDPFGVYFQYSTHLFLFA